ncbi:MAG TPA: IPTL-CTERM sorting domain-containing protein [Thermoanaerobaculia bacterium]|nr:IPTL-CTERM sorting domain-containing protein [Thermoanaerobaculia bacterium]
MPTSRSLRFLASLGLAAAWFCGAVPALAQTAPPLGVLEQFAVLGNSAVTGSTGAGTVVDGDVGSSPTASISNFPPSTVNPPFVLHLTNDLTVQQAHADAITAYNFLAAQGPGTVLAAQLDGAVLTSGIYSFAGGAADLAATGTLTLNGPGVFVFQVDSALTANVGSNVIGTADPCSVYWRVGTSATLNGVSFFGNVIADASITVGSGSNVTGKVIAGTGATGAVTMAGDGGNTIGGCAVAGCPPIVVSPPTLPAGSLETPYDETVSATGGAEPYTYDVTSGALPTGLTIDPATGAITGVPTEVGDFVFVITATDANGCPGSMSYAVSIAVAPVVVLAIPTLSEWGLAIFVALVALAALLYLRKRSQVLGAS